MEFLVVTTSFSFLHAVLSHLYTQENYFTCNCFIINIPIEVRYFTDLISLNSIFNVDSSLIWRNGLHYGLKNISLCFVK